MKDAGFRWRPLEMRRGRTSTRDCRVKRWMGPPCSRHRTTLGFVGASGEETIDSTHRPSIWNLGQPAGDVFFPSFVRSAKTFLLLESIYEGVFFIKLHPSIRVRTLFI